MEQEQEQEQDLVQELEREQERELELERELEQEQERERELEQEQVTPAFSAVYHKLRSWSVSSRAARMTWAMCLPKTQARSSRG